MIYERWIGTIYEQLKKSRSRDPKEQIHMIRRELNPSKSFP